MTGPTVVPPSIDDLVFVDRLGTGGYSDVYLYERRNPTMKIAVKVLKEGRLAPSQLGQFAAEAETMAQLADHPNIVQVFSTGTTADGRPYLVMKYYPPPNLGERCARERFPVTEVLRTGIKIAGAVETAHQAGIVHRDIKPANILVSRTGEPGLTDFGIAARAAESADDSDVGVSIPWSPPEVLSGESNGSVPGDVYALAATIWHLLVGRSPFEVVGGDNSPRAMVTRILRAGIPATGRADVPPSMERILAQSMAKKPEARPRSALYLARTLQAVEQELRLPRTEIVTIANDVRREAPLDHNRRGRDGDPGATRLRAPSRPVRPPTSSVFVEHHRASSETNAADGPRTGMWPAPAQPAPAQPARARRDGLQRGRPFARASTGDGDASPATVLRPARPGAGGPSEASADLGAGPTGSQRRRGVKTRWVILASGLLAAVIVIGAVLATRGGGGDSRDRVGDAGHTQAPASQLAGFDPPQQPAVVASRAAGSVSFTWADTNPDKGDYYIWSLAEGGASHRLTKPTLSLPAASKTKICIVVKVVRADGQASLESEASCG